MKDFVSLKINGIPIQAEKGTSILNAALRSGIYIPHLCSHPDLRPYEACKVCLVQLGKDGRIVPACSTKVEEGMEVESSTPAVDKLRRLSLELIFTVHPSDCSTCLKYSNCELQSLAQYLSIRDGRLHRIESGKTQDDRNPLFIRDTKRCIHCGRCVRACQELRGVKVLTYLHDENGSRVGVNHDLLMGDAGCRFCGTCVAVCPTGSLRDKDGVFRQDVPWLQAMVPCQNACPAHIDIPRFLRKVKQGKPGEALAVIRESVPFPHSLGMVCIHFCEDDCRRGKVNEPISICRMKRYCAVHSDDDWKQRRRIEKDTGKKVAVIGGGATGLTAAYYLRKQGHRVTILDKAEELGGQMRFGLPEHRLPKDVLKKEIADITEIGIEVRLNQKVCNPTALRKEYDAVLIATGTSVGSQIPLEGSDAENVYTALELLGRANRGQNIEKVDSAFIIGGGNVAFDIARTLKRRGVGRVDLACLEPRDRMTSTEEEIGEGVAEGIQIHPGTSFVRLRKDEGNRAVAIETKKVREFRFDENGKLHLETEEEVETYESQMYIFAVGQKAERFDEEAGIEQGKANVVLRETEDSFAVKDHPGLFVAGDAATGTKYVVWAVAAGRAVASEMDVFLGGDGNIEENLVDTEAYDPYLGRIEGFAQLERRKEEEKDPKERTKNSLPVTLPFTEENACFESGRCFQCDLRRHIQKVPFWSAYANSAVSREGGAE